MESLRVFDASGVPTPDETAQPFARLPVRALRDRGLSDAAFRVLGAVMEGVWSASLYSYASNEEIARNCGKDPRTVSRLLAELVGRRHIDLERDRAKPGAPRRIVLLNRLKASGSTSNPRRPKPPADEPPPTSEVTRCNTSEVTSHPVSSDHAPSRKCPPTRSVLTTPPLVLEREREKESFVLRAPTSAPRAVSRPPASSPAKLEDQTAANPPSPGDLPWWRAEAQRDGPWGRHVRRQLAEWTALGMIPPEPVGVPAGGDSLALDPPAG